MYCTENILAKMESLLRTLSNYNEIMDHLVPLHTRTHNYIQTETCAHIYTHTCTHPTDINVILWKTEYKKLVHLFTELSKSSSQVASRVTNWKGLECCDNLTYSMYTIVTMECGVCNYTILGDAPYMWN